MYTSMKDELTAELNAIREAGTYKNERPILTPQSNAVSAASARDEEGRDVLNFCANNYLGLADHPELIASAKRALDERGFGMASVRFICGTQDRHLVLEQKLSEFLGT
ncbi:MAG: aminotransferase class I/II-fold pyridoxal phosphate-dependent enzyme, partial [Dermabacter sp.]|nr:aminotransferase class I/II-fold pyridoxal phosphate-dependent enzyme [Dermabacter sp.]